MRHRVRRAKKRCLVESSSSNVLPNRPLLSLSPVGGAPPCVLPPEGGQKGKEGLSRGCRKRRRRRRSKIFRLSEIFFSLPLKGRRIEEGTDFPGERGAAAAADGRRRKGREREVGKVFPFRPSSRAKKGQRVAQRCKTKKFFEDIITSTFATGLNNKKV